MRDSYYLETPAIRVEQPLGTFFVASISARHLREMTFSERAQASNDNNETTYSVVGSQRGLDQHRAQQIGRYLESVDAAFPNSIILAANYTPDQRFVIDDEDKWQILPFEEAPRIWNLKIPTEKKLAAIIDGQHRLTGFDYAANERSEMELLCAIYFDIPVDIQAYIFATINFNQKKVNRSLAYELFNVEMDETKECSWSPDKLAVYLCRRLNTAEESPLKGHIAIAPESGVLDSKSKTWKVSTATVVDGICKLISSNSKKDRDALHKKPGSKRHRSQLGGDNSPLREMYKTVNDKLIFSCVMNFFEAVDEIFWRSTEDSTFIKRTVGIQALFDVLKTILNKHINEKDVSKEFFLKVLSPARNISFEDNWLKQASGSGKTRLKNVILLKIKLMNFDEIKNSSEEDHYKRLCK